MQVTFQVIVLISIIKSCYCFFFPIWQQVSPVYAATAPDILLFFIQFLSNKPITIICSPVTNVSYECFMTHTVRKNISLE